MLVIDGSRGEGGGQILRSALALSLITQTPFRIEKIRKGRAKPGLMRQHLAAVKAASQVGEALGRGAELGSQELVFTPRAPKAGRYHFAVGTAGSATLVLQTVLPALWAAKAPSSLLLEGGTHNPMAPPFDFIERSYLPLLERLGPRVSLTLQQAGFYPAGGGKFSAEILPVETWQRLDLPATSEVKSLRALARVINLPFHIAERETQVLGQKLGLSKEQLRAERHTEGHGPGNYLTVDIAREHLTEVICGLGAKGVSSEQVAEETARAVEVYLASGAPVGEYLADQLLLPLALGAGGSFVTCEPSLHTTTHAELLRQFLGVKISLEKLSETTWRVETSGANTHT
jgi:RNA 3'-terminal phosphate cyclase (ATP)